ncbi:hypothetical protein KFK09_006286 [Dendrobium nobile]|uniref:Uncharacterized protein n=1 Tax=Dendrobium nobile TaxID=94219 RepID=A0A8T3BQW4_DENNO|nr:hypothetical protein KFK09_006286 [Dendrobium nobile]
MDGSKPIDRLFFTLINPGTASGYGVASVLAQSWRFVAARDKEEKIFSLLCCTELRDLSRGGRWEKLAGFVSRSTTLRRQERRARQIYRGEN